MKNKDILIIVDGVDEKGEERKLFLPYFRDEKVSTEMIQKVLSAYGFGGIKMTGWEALNGTLLK